MSKRREYGAYQKARDIVVEQVALGQWPSATTDTLVKRAVDLAKIPHEIAYGSNKHFGQANWYAMNELMLDKLRKLYMPVLLPPSEEFPDGKLINPRAVYNVPTGRPMDPKRAEDPDAHAKAGLWIHIFRFQVEEAEEQMRRYQQRRSDSAATIATVRATDLVLHRAPPLTYAKDVWEEILRQIARFLRPAI